MEKLLEKKSRGISKVTLTAIAEETPESILSGTSGGNSEETPGGVSSENP